MIFYNKLTPVVWISVKDSGILLTLCYLSDPRQRRSSAQEIWEKVLDLLAEHKDVQLACPTLRYVTQESEVRGPKKPRGEACLAS